MTANVLGLGGGRGGGWWFVFCSKPLCIVDAGRFFDVLHRNDLQWVQTKMVLLSTKMVSACLPARRGSGCIIRWCMLHSGILGFINIIMIMCYYFLVLMSLWFFFRLSFISFTSSASFPSFSAECNDYCLPPDSEVASSFILCRPGPGFFFPAQRC